MRTGQWSVFRYEAVRRYAQAQSKAVFPRVIRPRAFLYMWIALALLLAAAGFTGWRASERFIAAGTSITGPALKP